MKLLARAPIIRPNAGRAERLSAAECISKDAALRRRPTARFVAVEDLDHLYRTGQSRQILRLRWTR